MKWSHINLPHKRFITYVWFDRWKMMRFHLLIFPFVGITNHINGYLTLRKRDKIKMSLKRNLGIQKIVLWDWYIMICEKSRWFSPWCIIYTKVYHQQNSSSKDSNNFSWDNQCEVVIKWRAMKMMTFRISFVTKLIFLYNDNGHWYN